MTILECLTKQFYVYFKQQNAIDSLRSIKSRPNTRIFAFEDNRRPGPRKFLTAELAAFYRWYRSCSSDERHFYELISESIPCRLYFDLEFFYQWNEELRGKELSILRDFLKATCQSIYELLGIRLCTDNDFIILDSSTDEKFSAHVIVHFPEGQLFQNNYHLKPLVLYICCELLRSGKCLVKADKLGDKTFLCDLQVYNKNRHFRIYLSSKCEKNAVLDLAKYCTFYGNKIPPQNYDKNKNEYFISSYPSKDSSYPTRGHIFVDSLIIPQDYNKFSVIDISRIPSIAEIRNLFANFSSPHKHLKIFDSASSFVFSRSTPAAFSQQGSLTYTSGFQELQAGTGGSSSPFPDLDDYMLCCVFKNMKSNASIRTWRFLLMQSFNKNEPIFFIHYHLNNCRYCFNKKQEHKNQNVYWSVDLQEFTYVQRCFDQTDCPNFVSQKFVLPQETCMEILHKMPQILKFIHVKEKYHPINAEKIMQTRFKLHSDSFDSSKSDLQLCDSSTNPDNLSFHSLSLSSAEDKRN